MDCAPLNLAHFHERRADKLLMRYRYEEAAKAIETSLLYVEDAYKHVQIPKALEVLKTQKWVYERKLNQIQICKLEYDKMKSKEIVPPAQIDLGSNNTKKNVANAQSIARSIDKTIKEFNDKYSSILMGNMTDIDKKGKENSNPNEQKERKFCDNPKTMLNETMEGQRRFSLIEEHLQIRDDDLPSLEPLELPAFDYTAFDV